MAEKKSVSPWLRGTLYVVAILFLPTFVIQLVRPDALNAGMRRPTLQTFTFRFLLDTGIFLDRMGRHESAISQFESAEQYAGRLTDTKYESLQEARVRLAESYMAAGSASEAEQTYAKIVQTSMDAGDVFRQKNQFDAAVPKYEDAEKFAQKLTVTKFASLLSAQRSLAGCLMALKRSGELEQVDARIITTLQDQSDPYSVELGDAYRTLAMARSNLADYAGAEQALLQANDIYNKIIEEFSGKYDPSGRALQAKEQKDFNTWYLAVTYFNEKKMDLALATAEDAFQVLSRRVGARGVPIGVYTAGLQAATALNNQEQVQVWQQRLSDLTPNRPRASEGDVSSGGSRVH